MATSPTLKVPFAIRTGVAAAALVLSAGAARPASAPAAFLTVPLASNQAKPSDAPAASVSADGRYVAFASFARLAVPDTNEDADIYVLDRVTGLVTLETPPQAGPGSIRGGSRPHLSGDGRLLMFEATDFAQFPPRQVVVLRDRLTGAIRRFERRGEAANGGSRAGAISADGRIAVFASSATNLTDGPDANGTADDVYSADIASMTIRLVSVDTADRQPAAGSSFVPAVSADGRYIAFSSTAPLAGAAATAAGGRAQVNVYLRDMTLGRTTRISVAEGTAAPNGSSYDAAISADGRFVAFVSEANNLVARDDNRAADVFLRDTLTGTTLLVSRGESGGAANGPSGHPAISADGGIVSFQSDASNLSCVRRCMPAIRDINLVADVFVFDRASRSVARVSVGRTAWNEPSIGPALDGTGTIIAFSSRHPLDATDDRDDYDLFIRVPGREGPGPANIPAGNASNSRSP